MKHSKIIYTVPGIGSLSFGVEGNYLLEKFDGTSLGSEKLVSTVINLSGQKTSRTTLKPRTIPCELAVRGVDADGKFSYELLDKLKQEICKIINPLYTGTLTRINRYGTYSIEVSPSAVPTFDKFVGATARFKVDFVADNPMWRDTKVKTFKIGGEYGTSLDIYNTLGVELPFIFKGIAQPNTIFLLKNVDTEEKIEHADTVYGNEVEFELNTETCEVLTRNSGEESFGNSNFIFSFKSSVDMVLKPGKNSFVLTAQNAEAVFTIEVVDMFVGVS